MTAAYVCLEDDTLSLATGLTLDQDLRGCGVPIIACVDEDAGLTGLAQAHHGRSGDGDPPVVPVRIFPLLERTCTPAIVLGGVHETLARAIHDEYVRSEVARGQTPASNPSLVPWDALPMRLQEANRAQADHIGVKLAAAQCDLEPLTDWDADRFGFNPDEVERLAKLEHERWAADYERAGWRHAPGGKDAKSKTHPALIPWDDLSESERDKDRNVVRLLPVFLARAGFQIVRRQAAASMPDAVHTG